MRERENLEHMEQDMERDTWAKDFNIAGVVSRSLGSLEVFKAAVMGDTAEAWIAERRCAKPPVGCGKSLLNKDGSPRFNFDDRDKRDLYLREWQISGMCPDCWNAMVKACEEEEAELERLAQFENGGECE